MEIPSATALFRTFLIANIVWTSLAQAAPKSKSKLGDEGGHTSFSDERPKKKIRMSPSDDEAKDRSLAVYYSERKAQTESSEANQEGLPKEKKIILLDKSADSLKKVAELQGAVAEIYKRRHGEYIVDEQNIRRSEKHHLDKTEELKDHSRINFLQARVLKESGEKLSDESTEALRSSAAAIKDDRMSKDRVPFEGKVHYSAFHDHEAAKEAAIRSGKPKLANIHDDLSILHRKYSDLSRPSKVSTIINKWQPDEDEEKEADSRNKTQSNLDQVDLLNADAPGQ